MEEEVEEEEELDQEDVLLQDVLDAVEDNVNNPAFQAVVGQLVPLFADGQIGNLVEVLQQMQIEMGEENLITQARLTNILQQQQQQEELQRQQQQQLTPPKTKSGDDHALANEGMLSKQVLLSVEGRRISISRAAAMQSGLLVSMLGDEEEDEEEDIPLLEVEYAVAQRVCAFLTKHAADPFPPIPKPLPNRRGLTMLDLPGVSEWDAKFIDEVLAEDLIFEIILAANYLDIPTLLDLGIVRLSMTLHNCKDMDQVNAFLQLDETCEAMTAEENLNLKLENSWLFQLPSAGEEED